MRFARRILFALLALIVVFLLLIVGGVVYLRSEAGSERVLKFAKDYLEQNQNTRIQYDEGRFELLSGFKFKNLRIFREDIDISADLSFPTLELEYSFSIFKRSINVSRFSSSNPKVLVKLTSPQEPQEVEPKESSEGSNFDQLIRNPPVKIVFENLEVQNLELVFASTNTSSLPSEIKLAVQGLDLKMSFEMIKDSLKSAGKLNIAKPAQLSNRSQSLTGSTRTKLTADFDGDWKIAIHREANQWLYSLDMKSLKAALTDLEFENAQTKTKGNENALSVQIPKLALEFSAHSEMISQELFKVSQDSVKAFQLTGAVGVDELRLDSNSDGKKSRIAIATQSFTFDSGLTQEIGIQGSYQAKGLEAAEHLSRSIPVALNFTLNIPRDLSKIAASGALNLASEETLRFKVNAHVGPSESELAVDGETIFTVNPSLARIAKSLASVKDGLQGKIAFVGESKKAGAYRVQLNGEIPRLKIPALDRPTRVAIDGVSTWDADSREFGYDGDVDFASSDLGAWRIKPRVTVIIPAEPTGAPRVSGQTEISQLSLAAQLTSPGRSNRDSTSNGKPPKSPTKPAAVILAKPFVVEHNVDLTLGKGRAEITARIPSLEVPDKIKLSKTNINLLVTSPDLKAARNFTLERFRFETDDSAIVFEAEGAGDLETKTVQSRASLAINVKPDFPAISGHRISGRVDAPISISILRGREIALNGEIGLRNLAWAKEKKSVSGVNGSIPFSEKLIWDGKQIRFVTLINQNPFERVDFERVRPLLLSTQQVRIDKIGWEEKSFGPFVGLFSLRQNMLFGHQFDVDLGAGRVYGELFVNAYPANLQFGLLARMTDLDLAETLPAKFLARMPAGDKKLSGRSGFVLNLNRSTIDGRIDITQIGGAQLIAMINVLDPSYEDEKMNKLRQVLQLGYPTSVAMDFAEGYMNLDVGLMTLGLASNQRLRGVPVSGFLSKATAGLMKETEKGPLQ